MVMKSTSWRQPNLSSGFQENLFGDMRTWDASKYLGKIICQGDRISNTSNSLIQNFKSTAVRKLQKDVDSVSTPLLYSYKTIRVSPRPRKKPLEKPRPPRPLVLLRPKAWRPVKPPVPKPILTHRRSENGSNILVRITPPRPSRNALRRWRIAVIEQSIAHDRYVARIDEINRQRQMRYARDVTRYQRALVSYNRALLKQQQGRLVTRKVALQRSRPRNPYTLTSTHDLGVNGNMTWYTRCDRYGNVQPLGQYFLNWGWQRADGTPFKDVFALLTFPDALGKENDSRCFLNLKRKRDDQVAHIGNILAERHKTLSYISGKIMQLVELKRNPLKVLRSLNVARGTRVLSDEFLAFQFGVRPLVSEIYAACKELESSNSLVRDKLVIRSAVESATKRQIPYSPGNVYVGGNGNTTWSDPVVSYIDVTKRVKTSYVLEYDINNGALDLLQRFGLANPLEIAWEVMPWSFVVDWVFPIGDWIRSFNNSRLVFSGGTKVVTTETLWEGTLSYDGHAATTGNVGYYYKGSFTGAYRTVNKVRTVLASEPISVYPEFKNPFSMYHILEGLALLRQRL